MREQQLCAEETNFALVLEPDEALFGTVEVESGDRLVVSGCLPGATQADGPGGATLEIRLGTAGRQRVTAIEIPPEDQGWWRHELPVEADDTTPIILTVQARLPGGERLLLRDLHLRSERRVAPSGAGVGPQILLISVDTLRHDTIAALGGEWPTPNLDRFVAESQTWTHHYAADSWTKPSHASLLTGYHPERTRCVGQHTPLHPSVKTLAQRFQAAGIATAGLVHDCIWLNPEYGFDTGFDEYASVKWHLRQMVREATNWIAEHRDRPFFFFLHTYDVHSDFLQLPYEGTGATREAVAGRFGVPDYGCIGDVCGSIRLFYINDGAVEPLAGEGQLLRFLYGCGVRSLDEHLGALFDDLRTMGAADNMMIVLTSDHGESFLEHGRVLHGDFWDEVMRVPLVIRWPGRRLAGAVRSELVTAHDVAPTLLAAARIDAGDLPGADLREPAGERPVFLGTAKRIVIARHFKAIFDLARGTAELYDLRADPSETIDLSGRHPQKIKEMRRLLDQRMASDDAAFADAASGAPAVATPAISDEEQERLRALGYL